MATMSVGIAVEPMKPSDAGEVFALWAARPHAFDQERHRDAFINALGRLAPPFGAWVVRDGGAVVAFAAVTPMRFNLALRGTMGEFAVYVAATHLRRGFGRALIAFVAGTTHGRDLEWLIAFIGESNAASRALFASAGWRSIGCVPRTRARQAVELHAFELLEAEA